MQTTTVQTLPTSIEGSPADRRIVDATTASWRVEDYSRTKPRCRAVRRNEQVVNRPGIIRVIRIDWFDLAYIAAIALLTAAIAGGIALAISVL